MKDEQMSQNVATLQVQTQKLLHGRLKAVRTAALALALVPLAAVAVKTMTVTACASGNVCGFVWQDSNGNGIQDQGELGIAGAVVSLGPNVTATNATGYYEFTVVPGTYQIEVQIPPGSEPSPSNVGSDDTRDSDGVSDGLGNSV